MSGLNKLTFFGNLGKDPDLRNLEGNLSVAKVTLATTEGYKDENGQTHTHTEWHNVVLWRGLAEMAEKYLKKGSMVCIEGKLRTRSYEDKNKEKRFVTEIIGDNVIMLDKKEST